MNRTTTARMIVQQLLAPFPNAKAHFQHYVKGTGEQIAVNLSDIWNHDEGLRHLFSFTVRPMIQRGSTSGSLVIPQTHLKNWNWRLALGSMTYNWAIEDQSITIESHTTYKWSPDEQRITRPIHIALAELKHESASPYEIIGNPFRLSLNALPNISTIPRPPLYRRLYL